MRRLTVAFLVCCWATPVLAADENPRSTKADHPRHAVLDLNVRQRKWTEVPREDIDSPGRRGFVRGVWSVLEEERRKATAMELLPKALAAQAKCEEALAKAEEETAQAKLLSELNAKKAARAQSALQIEQETSQILEDPYRKKWYESPYLYMAAGALMTALLLRYGDRDPEVRVVQP